jgi:NADH-quinone oxidoreductase subunit L
VGLCSYLLIGFWFEDNEKAAAGKKAFIVNRIGDFGFLLGMFFLIYGMGKLGTMSLEYDALQGSIAELAKMMVTIPVFGYVRLVEVVGICLFVGAAGKSAQLPLYVWLPDAMAGPTPVSALIHAATMVTAGVYMIARMGFLYSLAPFSSTVVALVGGLTALFAATIGMAQNDIKKVLAYSTVSQLGYMFVAVGVGAYSAGVFHLVTHAFFKACLFMGSGAVILACHHEQDIRRMGGLMKKMPWTGLTFLLATLCIAGLPPFSGFVSKDEILWMAYSTPNTLYPGIHTFIWLLCVIGAFCTAFYMTRLTMLTFFGEYRGGEHSPDFHHEMPYEKVHEVSKVMWVPLVILMFGFCSLGFLGKSQIFSGTNSFHHWLAPVTDTVSASAHAVHAAVETAESVEGHGTVAVNEHAAAEQDATTTLEEHSMVEAATVAGHGVDHEALKALEHKMMALSVVVALAGVLLGFLLYGPRKLRPVMPSSEPSLGFVHRMLLNKYWVDEIYFALIVNPIRVVSESFLWKVFDVRIIDGTVNGVATTARGLSRLGLKLQNGFVNSYAFFMVVGVAVVLGYLVLG